MSDVGRCYDNARIESFFATLKKEKLYQINTIRMTVDEVKTVVFRFIYYYNLRRIYSTNNGYPPAVYRRMYFDSQRTAA
jgi:transposase InsO family protein